MSAHGTTAYAKQNFRLFAKLQNIRARIVSNVARCSSHNSAWFATKRKHTSTKIIIKLVRLISVTNAVSPDSVFQISSPTNGREIRKFRQPLLNRYQIVYCLINWLDFHYDGAVRSAILSKERKTATTKKIVEKKQKMSQPKIRKIRELIGRSNSDGASM